MQSHKPPLILIVGPTAVGKTELAIQLAVEKVATAKREIEEEAAQRIAHL